MTRHFDTQARAEIQRSSFDRSHGHKTTLEPGYLIPIYLDEALPGDTFNLKMHAIARLATPIFPIMDNIYLDTQFFAVPYRLVWDNWEKFNGAQDKPTDSISFQIPRVSGTATAGGLGDYMGLPVGVAVSASALPLRAYNLIYNEWYRDQNLQDSLVVSTGDGPDNYTSYSLRKRGKRHDYFTSCLPWPQKGPGADVPISPVSSNAAPTFNATTASGNFHLVTSQGTRDVLVEGSSPTLQDQPFTWADPSLMATVNDIRSAVQIQKMMERDARGGTRYIELIKAHFGVTSPDFRMQRPEYLGGSSTPVNISQIHQTQATSASITPLGQVGAIGTAQLDGNRHGFTHSFTEHCLVIGLLSVRSDMTYQQRFDRLWTRTTKYDFFWPALAHLGEQSVFNYEILYTGNAPDDEVFGYQERYAEYRYKPSMVTGLFRSNHPQSLDAWHLAFDYTATPALNGTFIEEAPPIERIVAVPTEPKFILDTWFDLQCARPMPMYGTPGMMDHF